MKRKLEHDVSIAELMHLRESGMTNHQIAQAVGCAESTVYRYIGRRSQAVKYAALQNKPCPVATFNPAPDPAPVDPAPVDPIPDDPIITDEQECETDMEETRAVAKASRPAPLPVIKQTCVYEMQGTSCVFRIDTTSTVIEMLDKGGSVVSGMIDVADVDSFISELQKISAFLRYCKE